MFCGDSRHSVDAKNRVFVPKRFQNELPLDEEGNRTAVLTLGFEKSVVLFTREGFDRALKRMNTEAFAPAEHRTLQRLFFANTSVVTLDASGRLLLPEKLRKIAEIGKEIVMVGVLDRVEIWAAERWDEFEAQNEDAFVKLAGVLTGPSAAPGAGEEARA